MTNSDTTQCSSDIQPVIGLEIHCQLETDSRLFSAGPVEYDAPPNSRVTSYDLGMPGTLPVLNRRAVDLAIRAGLALDATIHSRSRFARKHYFYPDLPRGYQITQYDRPLCTGGSLTFDFDDRSRSLSVRRIHLEEDAGKSIHDGETDETLVDYNRAGTPLIEIVTEPGLREPAEAAAALRALHRLVVHLGICDGNMQEGSFRCDANVSITTGGGQLGPRVELKNLNSFRFVERGLTAEIERLRQPADDWSETDTDETRLYDPDADRTVSMRSKEASPDYRYVADPDLPALIVDHERIDRIRRRLPELPRSRRRRFVTEYGLAEDDAETLLDSPGRATFFESAVDEYSGDPGDIANLLIHELLAYTDDVTFCGVEPTDLVRTAELVDDETISSSAASTVIEKLVETGGSDESPTDIVDRLELRQVRDEGRLRDIIDDVIGDNPDLVEEYRDGKEKLFGHFMGQVMQASSGQADPEKASRILRDKLEG